MRVVATGLALIVLSIATVAAGGGRGAVDRVNPADVWRALVRLARSEDAGTRAYGIYGLALFLPDDAAVLPLLREGLSDRDAGVRREAILALMARAEPAAVPIESLPDLLLDPDPGVRTLAGGALVAIAEPRAPVLWSREFVNWTDELGLNRRPLTDNDLWRVDRLGAKTHPFLVALRRHPEPGLRGKAATLLARYVNRPETILPELAVALRDRDPHVRRLAAEHRADGAPPPDRDDHLRRRLDAPLAIRVVNVAGERRWIYAEICCDPARRGEHSRDCLLVGDASAHGVTAPWRSRPDSATRTRAGPGSPPTPRPPPCSTA